MKKFIVQVNVLKYNYIFPILYVFSTSHPNNIILFTQSSAWVLEKPNNALRKISFSATMITKLFNALKFKRGIRSFATIKQTLTLQETLNFSP